MSAGKNKTYSKELKAQIAKESIETNNYSAVSRKHNIPVTTLYGWVKRYRNKNKLTANKNTKKLEKELADVRLENRILKELLKKSHQLWLND